MTTDAQGLVRWHNGTVSLAAAQKAGAMTVTAPRWLARTLSEWGRLSPYADVTHTRPDSDRLQVPDGFLTGVPC